jgi:hypothetical protein
MRMTLARERAARLQNTAFSAGRADPMSKRFPTAREHAQCLRFRIFELLPPLFHHLKQRLIIFLLVIACPAFAQDRDSLNSILTAAENELADLQHQAFRSRTETERIEGNKLFIAAWDRIAANPMVLEYPFSKLKDVSVLGSDDKKVRVVTWNLHKDDGTHIYFGYVFVNNSRRIRTGLFRYRTETSFESFKLLDRSMTVRNPETYVGSPDKWYGMLYTQLIDCGDYYTLLAWDGNDKLTQRKFVDVLYFRGDGTPVFGKDVFRFPRKNPRRLMFEYSSEVSMSLKYHPKKGQIIYSHLASKQEGDMLDGQFQFYGPDGSFDALELRKGKWVVVEDIDARNEKSRNDNAPKPDPRKQEPVYKPR